MLKTEQMIFLLGHLSDLTTMCVRVYVVYEDTNVYNDMGMTEALQFEGGL
jgi:hypothetical protein